MSETFTKLCSGIIASTVWGEPHSTRSVWTTLLALADAQGYVGGSVPGLARLANATLEETERALATFLAPDPYSRTPDHEGRRIAEVAGGWRLLNHARYRELRSADDRRDQNREASRRYRSRQRRGEERAGPPGEDEEPEPSAESSASVSSRQHASAESAAVSPGQPKSAQAEAEAEGEAEAEKQQLTSRAKAKAGAREKSRGTRLPEDFKPSRRDWESAAEILGTTDRAVLVAEWRAFRDYWLAESGARASKLNWSLAFLTWCRKTAERERRAIRRSRRDSRSGEPETKLGALVARQTAMLRRPR